MAIGVPSPGRLRFDEFEVDLQSGDIFKRGARLRLQEQPFQVLRMLLERRGELVTREELRQELWPRAVVDFDDGLNTAIRKIRELLGDSAERPRFIETVPRRGYRFIATAEAAQHKAVAGNGGLMRRRGLAIALAGVLVLAAAAGAGWLHWTRSMQGEAIRAIAVLPLENRSADPAQDYFAAGITDSLTTELARAAGSSLRVISRGSAEKYRGKPLAEVARELDVDAVVQGSVARSGDGVRITAQLIDARRDKHLWATSYDRDLRDVLGLQSEIAATVARRVELKLNPRANARLAGAAINPQAYDLYQRGRYRAFSNNPREIAAAIELLERSVSLEPNLAAAHALLARAYATQAFLVAPQHSELQAKALDEVSRALKLDPDLADAYLARGLVYWTHHNGFPHERAIGEIKRALELDPNLAEAHHWLGTIFNHVGLLDRGRRELDIALRLDPANAGIRYRIAITLLLEGRPREALPALEATRAFFPANAAYGTALALFELDRKEEAAAAIADYLRQNARDEGGVGHALQALLHADAGRHALAERSIEAAVRSGTGYGHFHHAAYTIGAAYALLDRPRDAVLWLRRAADDGFPCYPLYERDRSLAKLRADAGFRELMKDLKQRWERYKALP